jgi:cyclopropane-fatty-acyl-phospholipid synthase
MNGAAAGTAGAAVEASTAGASAAAIRHHYDAGTAFYALWLDPTMCYSCALWEGADDTLEAAQVRKLEHHIAQAGAQAARRVLDVGCGWGGLLRRLVDVHGVGHAVGLTLSEDQARHVAAFGDPRIEVRLERWERHVPEAPYDAVVSIGAFEHFARPELDEGGKLTAYRRFFERCHAWLRPGGRLSLQTIVYGDAERADLSPFFAREIFPESDLPHLHDLVRACHGLFEVRALRNEREHYERTVEAWRRTLGERRAAAVALVGEQQVARYEHYFKLVTIGFHVGTMGLARVALRRIDRPRRPRGRDTDAGAAKGAPYDGVAAAG